MGRELNFAALLPQPRRFHRSRCDTSPDCLGLTHSLVLGEAERGGGAFKVAAICLAFVEAPASFAPAKAAGPGAAERRGPAVAAGWLPSVAPAALRGRAAVSPAGGGGPGSIGPGAAAAALQLPFQQPGGKKKPKKESHEDVETSPAKSKEQIPVVMALLKLDPAGFQAIKSCQAPTYRGGRESRDETPALEDLFPAPSFAEEPAEMSRRSASPERCGERTR